MNDFVTTLLRWTLRISLMLVGMVFFLCLLAVAAVLAAAWGLRALWAKLTGQPVTPWVMRMSPRNGWQTVYRSGAEWMSQSAGGAQQEQGARTGAERRGGLLRGAGDVTDVQPREIH